LMQKSRNEQNRYSQRNSPEDTIYSEFKTKNTRNLNAFNARARCEDWLDNQA